MTELFTINVMLLQQAMEQTHDSVHETKYVLSPWDQDYYK